MAGGRVGITCAGWRTLTPHKGNDRITQCDSLYIYGKAPDVLRPGIVGMRGSMVIRLGSCMTLVPPPSTPPRTESAQGD